MKKIRVREAKERDIGLFSKLFKEYLIEHYENGSHVLPEENLPLYEEIFKMYVKGEEKGIVLFVGECAVAMFGSQGEAPIKTDLNPIAQGFGIYVQPEYRGSEIAVKLSDYAKKKLIEMGFKTIIDAVLVNDKHAVQTARKLKYKPFQCTYVYELKE